MDPSRHQIKPARVAAEFGAPNPVAQSDEYVVDEEPDDARSAENLFIGGTSPAPVTAEELIAEGDEAYVRARTLEELHGLTASTVAEYRAAGRRLIGGAAQLSVDHERQEEHEADPVRYMKIADCLAKQALATDISPYEDTDYKNGGRWEQIPHEQSDGSWVGLTHHQYLQKISRQYLLRASGIFMEEGHAALAGELIAENPAEVIPEAALVAAIDVDATQEYTPPFARSQQEDSQDHQAIDPDQVERFINTHAKQPDTGAMFIVRMSEHALEELVEPEEFSLV